jgi:hypothetical protein
MPFRVIRAQLITLFLLLSSVSAAPQIAVAGDSLDDLREEVEENDEHRRDDSGSSEIWDDDDSDITGGDFLEAVDGRPLLFVLSAPWWGPHVALNDDFSTEGEFMIAPYAWGIRGHVITGRVLQPTLNYSGRMSLHSGNDFDDLQWSTVRIQIDTTSRFGFDTEWTRWVESTPSGDDVLSSGDVNLRYRFAQSEHVEFHTGIGVNWLADGSDGEAGVNFIYSVDLFPAEPWTLSASIEGGTLGDAGLFHGRVGGGAVWWFMEIFAGYEVYRFGRVNLDGPFAGAAIWF